MQASQHSGVTTVFRDPTSRPRIRDHFCGLVRLVLNYSALRLCTGTAIGPLATGGALPVVTSVVAVKLVLVLVWVLNFLHQVPKHLSDST